MNTGLSARNADC